MTRSATRTGGLLAAGFLAGLSGATTARAGAPLAAEVQRPPAAGPAGSSPPTGGAALLDQGRLDRAPPTAPVAAPGASAAGAGRVVVQGAPSPAFTVTDVQVQGSSLPLATLRAAVKPFVGRTLDANGAGAIADALAAAYADSDVALYTVTLPTQTFARGAVLLTVTEGRLEAVDVTGDDARLVRRVQALTAPLIGGAHLRKSAFDRALLLAQSIPGVTIRADFARGGAAGAARLRLAVTSKRFKIGFGLSDRGQNLLGRTQVSATAEANSILRAGDQTTFVVAVPTDIERFRYLALAHTTPVGADGATAGFSIAKLTTRPEGTGLRGEAVLGSLRASYPCALQGRRPSP